MYTYLKPFIGIPLSQLNFKKKPKSAKLISELEEHILEDVSFNNYMENKEECKKYFSPKVSDIFDNIEKLINNDPGFEKFQPLFKKYKLDFHSNYNGSGDSAVILGFYIDKLMPLPDFNVSKIKIDLVEIEKLTVLFDELVQLLFTHQDYQSFKDDDLIGAFYNIHSS